MKIHQWTHNGDEVMVLRFCEKNGASSHDFFYPLTVGETATAPDWDGKPGCGHGLHGWPWGMFVGDGKDPDWGKLWQVYGCKAEDVIPCDEEWGKVKFRAGVLRFSGGWRDASQFVLAGQMEWVFKYAEATAKKDGKIADGDSSASAATGYRSASAATGDRSASAATGDRSASAATGDRSASAATGNSSASAATGDRSASEANGESAAAVCTGLEGKVKAGPYSALALAWWNEKAQRSEMRVALIGKGDGKDKKLKADTWYKLNARGQFVAVRE